MALLPADAQTEQAFFAQMMPHEKPLPYDFRALIPQLNQRGMDGWELVTLVPVHMGINGDMRIGGDTNFDGRWTNTYLCTFKRRLP